MAQQSHKGYRSYFTVVISVHTADFGIHLPFCKGGSGQDQVSCGARHPEVDGDPPGQGGRCQHSQQDGQNQPRPHVWTGAVSFQCDLSLES